jgi:hypothetical protein
MLDSEHRSQVIPIYRASLAKHMGTDTLQRGQILAVDALRHGHDEIAWQLYNPPKTPPLPWQCRWSTASNISLAQRAALIGQTGPIRSVALGRVRHMPAAVTIGTSRVASVWNLMRGTQVGVLRGHREPLTAVAVGGDETTTLVLTGDAGGAVCCSDLLMAYHATSTCWATMSSTAC